MSKYFKKEKSEEFLLSQLKKIPTCYFSQKEISSRTKYLLEVLGDVYMSKDLYYLFIEEFSCFGGKYDVRLKSETLKDIYDITRKYPFLSERAIEEIWFTYIRDFYLECSLLDVLDEYIKTYGMEDQGFELFIDYVETKSDIHQVKYIKESLRADELIADYGKDFVSHIKSLILRQHYTYDEIEKILPEPELILSDQKHISEISSKTRIFFGCCKPVSYTMFDILLEKKTLDTYTETPTYYISVGGAEQATFTKVEFLESIQKTKVKKLKK